MSDDDGRGPLRRRTFLGLVGAGGLVAVLPATPGCGDDDTPGPRAVARFFTPEERETIEALAGAILPEDETVGAVGAGAVEYIDRWLTAFENPEPDVYRGGPFSGRHPFPDPETGQAGRTYPEGTFHQVLPLSRLQELAFRIELDGSDAVPGGDINAGVLPTTRGLRVEYREAAERLEAFAVERGFPRFAAMSEPERLEGFRTLEKHVRDTVLEHLCEGMFGDPVYGGNPDRIAWTRYHYDGDSQPLGYTLYDPEAGEPFDRPDKPTQSLDPALPNEGLEPDVERFIHLVVLFQDGERFV